MAYIKKIKLPRVETPYEILDANAVPNTRKVNGKQLNKDITLSAADVGALPNDTVIPSVPDNIVKYTAISNVEATTPLDADSLQGHAADYFATATGLASVNSNVSAMESDITTMKSDITTTKSDITTTKSDITTMKSDITTMKSDITTAKTDISNLKTHKMNISGGTMTGALVAQNNTNYTTKQVRNIFISTSGPSGGSNGDIWIKYAE